MGIQFTVTHNFGSGLMDMITMHSLITGRKLNNLLRMQLMLYTVFMAHILILSTLLTYTLQQVHLMIGTEEVLVPDMPSPLNAEILDTMDSFYHPNKLFPVERSSLLE